MDEFQGLVRITSRELLTFHTGINVILGIQIWLFMLFILFIQYLSG